MLTLPIKNNSLLFIESRQDIVPSVKKPRGPEFGTAWRRANWKFYETGAQTTAAGAVVVDIGAGRGDLKPLFERPGYLAVDVYAYPEIDIVGDVATQPFLKSGIADVILLSNVLEHVSHPRELLKELARILKPGGRVYLAVPFLIKLHQVPVDSARYTHFQLDELFREAGFTIRRIESVYTPFAMLRSGLQSALAWTAASGSPAAVTAGRAAGVLLRVMGRLSRVADPIVVPAERASDLPSNGHHAYVAGYQCVLETRHDEAQ